jgi:uncharacterized protein (TIGR02186 family)
MIALLLAVAGALAQEAPREDIEIGLSTDHIAITSGFSGADLTIFGALDNADPLVMRHGRYDIIVVLEGPPRSVVVRRKDRVLGMWINMESETFLNVPESYSLATTRAMQDVASDASFKRLSLGAASIYLEPAMRDSDPQRLAEFTLALREQKKALGLYTERIGGVQFLSSTLFRATLSLPPNVPVGTHRARAFLFKNGDFMTETSSPLVIFKAGIEESIHRTAHAHSLFYGIGAVFLAIAAGWLGRVLFRKD